MLPKHKFMDYAILIKQYSSKSEFKTTATLLKPI